MRSSIPLLEDFVIEDMNHWPQQAGGFSILARMNNGDIWISNWRCKVKDEASKQIEILESKSFENGVIFYLNFNGWIKAEHKWIRLDEMNIPTFGTVK